MKKIASILLIPILFLMVFSSCKEQKKYQVDYPATITTEYLNENYIEADPNLIHLYCAENSTEKFEIPGGYGRYYAIKDVSMDEYLTLRKSILMVSPYEHIIVKNKKLVNQEILSYELEKIEIYKFDIGAVTQENWETLGNAYMSKSMVLLDSLEASSFQSYIIDCLETKKYCEHKTGEFYDQVSIDGFPVRIRISFAKYENLVWDAAIRIRDDKYYVYFYWYTKDKIHPEGYWDIIYLPISPEISALIPKQ